MEERRWDNSSALTSTSLSLLLPHGCFLPGAPARTPWPGEEEWGVRPPRAMSGASSSS